MSVVKLGGLGRASNGTKALIRGVGNDLLAIPGELVNWPPTAAMGIFECSGSANGRSAAMKRADERRSSGGYASVNNQTISQKLVEIGSTL